MEFIAIGADERYIVSIDSACTSQEIRDAWDKDSKKLSRHNIKLYGKIYREEMEFPADVTAAEELETTHERYGDIPMRSKEYVAHLRVIQFRYANECLSIDFVDWISTFPDCSISVAGNYVFEL